MHNVVHRKPRKSGRVPKSVTAAVAAVAMFVPAFGLGGSATAAPSDNTFVLPNGMISKADFNNPPANARPGTRWWFGSEFSFLHDKHGNLSEDQTRQQLDAIAKAGFGRVEIAYGDQYWATETQRKNFEAALEEGQKLGIQVDTTLGAGWPLSTPNTSKGTNLDLQELQYGRTDVAAGATFNAAVPKPYDDPTNTRGGKLVAVTAAKVVKPGPAVTTVNTPPTTSTVLDPDSLIDLTSQASAGSIDWTAPTDGNWILFGFWQRSSKKKAHDHFNHEAIEKAIDYVEKEQFSPKAKADFAKVGYSAFEDSLEIDAEGLFWDDAMAQQFKTRRGYDITKYLPLMYQQGMNHYWVPDTRPTADFDLSNGNGERLRNDYYELISDLYIDEHLTPMSNLAKQLGVKYRAQPAFGMDLNTIRSARSVAEHGGLADDESFNAGDVVPYDLESTPDTWRFALDHHRFVASGSHQGGSNEISDELGAQPGTYVRTLADYKGIMDKEWAAGTTRPILHGTSYQTDSAKWPGDAAFGSLVGESWNSKTFPQWNSFKPLNDYWGRGTMVLQTGKPQVDVAVYEPDAFLPSAATPARPAKMKSYYDAQSMEDQGFTIEYVDPDGIRDNAAGKGTATLYPNGPSYKTLVIDQRSMPADVAESILAHAKAGLGVVFVGSTPAAGISYANASSDDARVKAAVASMLALPNVTQVPNQASTINGLRAIGAQPAAQWSTPSRVYTQRRSTDAADYYYLYNASGSPVSFDAGFVGNGSPYTYNLWDGNIAPMASYHTQSGRTEVPVKLSGRETAVIAVAKHAAPTRHVTQSNADRVEAQSDGSLQFERDVQPQSPTGPVTALSYTLSDGSQGSQPDAKLPASRSLTDWNLKVERWGSDGKKQVFDGKAPLGDWRKISGLQTVSGVGTYHTTFNLGDDWIASDRGVRLNLGEVDNAAISVSVNGKQVAPDSVAGRIWDVTKLLTKGDNSIDVTVATTLRNQVTAEQHNGDTQAYGLVGPVTLMPYSKFVLAPAVSNSNGQEPGGSDNSGNKAPVSAPSQNPGESDNAKNNGDQAQKSAAESKTPLARTGAGVLGVIAVVVAAVAIAGISLALSRSRRRG
ncbi:glycosyl hydrolase [Bifidobacterium sp. ESL0745]|uniref:glycosyl hydrolase n=1 Tax=Bifidobacterium sp. ESL0745 TaxID=2983226 RepID=UPI0023F75D2B|nr:glycosyl hydrolase [Bifidobacterium sp. ESL0745]MDF7666028.1 glycosyl hydrolase [Bifidobacterium sp. ESL0745]